MTHIQAAIQEIDQKIQKLQQAKYTLTALNDDTEQPRGQGSRRKVVTTMPSSTRTRTPMSEEAKQRVREAQQRRWAGVRAGATTPAAPAETTIDPAAAQEAESAQSANEQPATGQLTRSQRRARDKQAEPDSTAHSA